jgi:hypothetical protein
MTVHPKYRFNLDRRSGKDRRSSKHFQFVNQLVTGRRAGSRRFIDRRRVAYYDRYHPSLLRLVVLVLLLSVADAILTVNLIRRGAVELNPVMDFYLTVGPKAFLAVKYLLTSLSVFILVVYSNMRPKGSRLSIASLFPWIIAALASVVVWEIYLLVKIGW